MTTGELFISPIGLSKVTELSPKKMTAFMMGVYFILIICSLYFKFIANATITGSDEVPEPGFMTTMIENITGFAGATTDSTIEGVQSLLNYTSVFTVGVVAIGMALLVYHYTNIKICMAFTKIKTMKKLLVILLLLLRQLLLVKKNQRVYRF